MPRWMLAASIAMLAGLVHAAELDIDQCRFPEAPLVPDGATATEEEMGLAGAEIRQFVSEVQSSLECLTEAEQSLGEDITEEQQAQLVTVYNNGVDQMNSIASQYNEQVQVFKAR